MIDFQWELKQVVSGIRKGLLEKQVTFFLRPHDAIWGDNSTDFTQLADEIMALLPDKQAQRQFLSVCLGSFLLNPTKAPTIFKDWFLSKITVQEIVGCNVPFDTLLSWSWGRAAFPVVDPRSETDTVYYAMLGCHQENIDVIVPNWISTVLDKKAINAVRVAIYTTKSVYDDKNFYFWPFVNPNRPVHGESHGLPLYLSCMSLASDKQIPLGSFHPESVTI